MSDASLATEGPGGSAALEHACSPHRTAVATARVRRRQRRERLFRACGTLALGAGLAFVIALFASIIADGHGAFWQWHLRLDVELSTAELGLGAGPHTPEQLDGADYAAVLRSALYRQLPELVERRARREAAALLSSGAAFALREQVLADPSALGGKRSLWVLADDDADLFLKGKIERSTPEAERKLTDRQLAWLERLQAQGRVASRFNLELFTGGDSREPELAGLGGALLGSLYTMLLTLLLSFPLGVAAALYLEELAPKRRWLELIEVAINNLAAVPSIVFGLLGLALFINLLELPRSSPLVAALVLGLMTLPVVIIASRAALRSVPHSIRQAALALGASRWQAVLHHVVPLALPGMLTGAIVGMARALGETAPLLMIGMVAFLVDVPRGLTDPATVLPVQIFLWADSPERAFAERTSAAIIVLLVFLMLMSSLAVLLRQRFERRW